MDGIEDERIAEEHAAAIRKAADREREHEKLRNFKQRFPDLYRLWEEMQKVGEEQRRLQGFCKICQDGRHVTPPGEGCAECGFSYRTRMVKELKEAHEKIERLQRGNAIESDYITKREEALMAEVEQLKLLNNTLVNQRTDYLKAFQELERESDEGLEEMALARVAIQSHNSNIAKIAELKALVDTLKEHASARLSDLHQAQAECGRLLELRNLQNTCAQCLASLHEGDEIPHCECCNVGEDEEHAWLKAVHALRDAIDARHKFQGQELERVASPRPEARLVLVEIATSGETHCNNNCAYMFNYRSDSPEMQAHPSREKNPLDKVWVAYCKLFDEAITWDKKCKWNGYRRCEKCIKQERVEQDEQTQGPSDTQEEPA